MVDHLALIVLYFSTCSTIKTNAGVKDISECMYVPGNRIRVE